VLLGPAIYTVSELSAALDKDCPRAQGALSLVKPLANMGLAALPGGLVPHHTQKEHDAFLASWELREEGDPSTALRRSYVLEEALRDAPEMLSAELRYRQRRALVQMLYEEADCFATTLHDLQEPAEAPPLEIQVTGGPVKQRFYRLAPDDTEYLQQELKDLKGAGLIRTSQSPWSSPTFVVRSSGHRPRKVVDYRKVNLLTVGDTYPLPDIHGIFDSLGGSECFGTSDLKSGFLQVPVAPDSIPITAFTCPYGLYDYLRAAFGLKNCPSHFMRCMDNILDASNIRGGADGGN
jgi:hypothetical protein